MDEVTRLMQIIKLYEDKLKELMPEAEFRAFIEQTARATFLSEVMAMPDGEFKQTIIDNWSAITAPVEIDGGLNNDK